MEVEVEAEISRMKPKGGEEEKKQEEKKKTKKKKKRRKDEWGRRLDEARRRGATGGALSHTRKNSPLQLQQRPSASTDQFPHHQHRAQRKRQVRLGLQKLLEDTS